MSLIKDILDFSGQSETETPYVDMVGFGEQCLAQPGILKDMQLQCFLLPASNNAVQKTVDKYLSLPHISPLEYRAVGNMIMVNFFNYPYLASEVQKIGHLNYKECTFLVPLIEKEKGSNKLGRLVFWSPYVFVDNDMPLIIGRETYGYPKEWGGVSLPSSGNIGNIGLDAKVFQELTEKEALETMRLIDVNVGDEGPLESAWHQAGEFISWLHTQFKDMEDHLICSLKDGLDVTVNLLELLWKPSVNVVNLKQFRKASRANVACYQAIVESPLTPLKIHSGGPIIREIDFQIQNPASHQIIENFGFPSNGKVSPFLSFWLNMDMQIEVGSELWES